MRSRVPVLAFVVLAIAVSLLAIFPVLNKPQAALAAEDVFASPLNGGCYIAEASQCRIHIDPYTVNVGVGNRLQAVRLQANGTTVYDYKTDVSNPPPFSGATYTISNVALDFAATCGTTYVINMLGKANNDANFLNMGQTASFTCPSYVP